MKHQKDQMIETLNKYTYWHCGDEVLAATLVRDSLELAESLSESDKELHHRAVRIIRRELRYLDRLERRDWNNAGQAGGDAALHGLLHKLGFEYRDVVVFHLICGYSVREIADILGVTHREIRHRVAAVAGLMQGTASHVRRDQPPKLRRSLPLREQAGRSVASPGT